MKTYNEPKYDDTDTVESLALEIEDLNSQIGMICRFLDEQLDASPCENCGHIHKRSQMLAPYGLDMGSSGKPQARSSRWFCGYCMDAARARGGNQPEVRDRIGEWLALGYGRKFLREMDSHYAHLGPGANHAPVAERLRREYATEIEKAARKAR